MTTPRKTFARLWQATTTNRKTGNVPTMAIGATRADSLASCQGCPLLHVKDGGQGGAGTGKPTCYAQYGTAAMGHSSMTRSYAKRPERYTADHAIDNSARSAKMARIGSIGDPSRVDPDGLRSDVRKMRAAGLDIVGYTHRWADVGAWLRGILMASCDTLAQCDDAINRGWRAAVVLPSSHKGRTFTTPAGRKGIVCPALTAAERGKTVTCNQCRLCNAGKAGPVIGFPDHGPTAQAENKARKARAARFAAAMGGAA